MERATSSGERTPLVQPTYVFESSLMRRYQKRLRNFQCTICVSLLALMTIAILVTASYNLNESSMTPPVTNLTMRAFNLTSVPSGLEPLMKNTWPLKGRPPSTWAGDQPTPETITSAITHGNEELRKKRDLERNRPPLDRNSPALRAQRASATAEAVKPMSDTGYAVEQATRALVNNTKIPRTREGGVGQGPPTNGSFHEPAYCQQITPVCPQSKYRSMDGSCNNLANPLRWGVSNTPFRRALPPFYGDGISSPRSSIDGSPLPSARDVSVTVHRPSYAHDISFTVMLAVWGQFVDHDITATALMKGANNSAIQCCSWAQPPHPECLPVPLGKQDPFYQQYNVTCMEFVRSASAPTCHFGPREQLNQASAFIDASTVYGFDDTLSRHLRVGSNGKLRMLVVGDRELLPQSTDPNDGCNTADQNAVGRYCFETGDDRANENLHLTTMHLIWARQHNRIADILTKLNKDWNDEKLYQEARRIVGAQMQHITYNEFLPNILGRDVMWALNLTLKTTGYSNSFNPHVNPSVANNFAAAAFRFAHTLLPGLIHSADVSRGTINYVQLHEMLFNPYQLYFANGTQQSLNSAMNTNVHSVDPHVTTELSNHLFEHPSSPCGLDLVSLNIQRGRDHGLTSYPHWREICGFKRPSSFNELRTVFDEQSFGRIATIYRSVDDIDLYTGALAENPQGRLLGPTLTCLLSDQFLRLKIGDRFWYETSDANVGFTMDQLTELRKTTLAGVICANEDLLELVQPRAMEEVSPENPLVQCKEIPQPDFNTFQEIR